MNWKAAGAAIALSAAAWMPASAAPTFTVDPSVLGGPAATFDADYISGASSSLITRTGATTVDGQGWVRFTEFSNNGVPIDVTDSGLNIDYRLWLTYSYSATLVSGSYGLANSLYQVDSLTFTVFGADPSFASANFVQASLAGGVVTAPSVSTGASTVYTIGSGSLITGVAGLNSLGGAFFNSVTTYLNTAFGDTFFIDPVPFYNVAFNEFNNTSQGISQANIDGAQYIAINQQSGGVDFTAVPEPASLALVGLALFGAGYASRRGRKNPV